MGRQAGTPTEVQSTLNSEYMYPCVFILEYEKDFCPASEKKQDSLKVNWAKWSTHWENP